MAETKIISFDEALADFQETAPSEIDFMKQPDSSFTSVINKVNAEVINKNDKEDLKEAEAEEEAEDNEKKEVASKGEVNKSKKDKISFSDVIKNLGEENEDGTIQNKSSFTFLNKLVEDKKLFLFEDKTDLSEYSDDELSELLEENIKKVSSDATESALTTLFEALPQELQIAVKYASDGGNNIKELFKALASTSEIKELRIGDDDEEIIRNYYRALEWEEEDINDKISSLLDHGEELLQKEAVKVKPKLDKMNDEIVQAQLVQQERVKEAHQKEMQSYFSNAEETIKKGSLGNLKLDKKTQISLYSGITQPTFTTRRGTPTNELGYLLEKYQYTEPNFEKIYKVLWLLKDEEDFFKKFGQNLKNNETENIVRRLKMDEGTGKQSINTAPTNASVPKIKTMQRPVSFLSGL